jgi:CMP-N,N'-diacetyllegionaminic acid synthase
VNILITICARGGSKGIPGKNIKPLAGKPVIEYSIEQAQKFIEKNGGTLVLSTDDQDIKDAAAKVGLETDYSRPAFLASDTAGKIDTIKDLVFYEEKKRGVKFDYVLDLDLTSPLRTIEDLEKGFSIISEDGNALTLFSVSPAERNPYFNMVELNSEGYYSLPKMNPDGSVLSRQSAPPVYDLNASFYWYKRSFFDTELKSPITNRSLIFCMDHLCFDMDNRIDFEVLEFLLTNNKIDFM